MIKQVFLHKGIIQLELLLIRVKITKETAEVLAEILQESTSLVKIGFYHVEFEAAAIHLLATSGLAQNKKLYSITFKDCSLPPNQDPKPSRDLKDENIPRPKQVIQVKPKSPAINPLFADASYLVPVVAALKGIPTLLTIKFEGSGIGQDRDTDTILHLLYGRVYLTNTELPKQRQDHFNKEYLRKSPEVIYVPAPGPCCVIL